MKNIWESFEFYLIVLGLRSTDYSYPPEMIFEHINYFKRCWEDHISCYYALEMFEFEEEL